MNIALRQQKIAEDTIYGHHSWGPASQLQREWTRSLNIRYDKIDASSPIKIFDSGKIVSLVESSSATLKAHPDVLALRANSLHSYWTLIPDHLDALDIYSYISRKAIEYRRSSIESLKTENADEIPRALPIAMNFAPSTKLAQYWIDGIEYYAKLDQSSPFSPGQFTPSDMSTVKTELAQRVFDTFVEELRARRMPNTAKLTLIDKEMVFDDYLEYKLSESFAIRPKDLGDFIGSLASEMLQYFVNGGAWEGKWGKIIGHKGDVLAFLTPKVPPKFENRSSTSLEVDI